MHYDFKAPRKFLEDVTVLLLKESCYRGCIFPANLPEGDLAVGYVKTDLNDNTLMVHLSELYFNPFVSYFKAISSNSNLPSQISDHGYVRVGKRWYKPKLSFLRGYFEILI